MEKAEVKNIFERTVIQLSFIYGFTIQDMVEVLNECESFDKLITIAMVAKKLDLGIIEAWQLYIEETQEIKEAECEVIDLWKHKKNHA